MSADIYLVNMISDLRVLILAFALFLFVRSLFIVAGAGGKQPVFCLTVAFLLLFTGIILPTRQTLAEMFLVPRINAGLSTEGMPPELAEVWQKFSCDYLDRDFRKCRRGKNGQAESD